MTVTINGTTGYTGPIGAIGDLSTTGNTTLGDASGDTLTINGSTTTFTQGTANGVAYLNGSKVLTTGSALVFDGTNLGVGVTPSAWLSSQPSLQLKSGSYFATAGQYAFFTANTYLNSSSVETYVANGSATKYTHAVGQHQWFTAPSGTAGNAITFTQAMTLVSSGNLGVGTTNPTQKLSVYETALLTAPAGGVSQLLFGDNASDSAGRLFYNHGNDNLQIFVNSAEAARIDSSGNLLVGITSSNFKINVTSSGGDVASFNAGAAGQLLRLSQSSANSVIFRMNNSSNNFWDTQVNTDNSITWDYNDAERMRIDSSGRVMVNTTTAGGRFSITGTSQDILALNSTNGSTGLYYGANQSTGTAAYFTTTSGQAGLISLSGATTSYISGSDYRLKDNIRPLTGALTKVAALRPVAFEWKSDGAYSESFIAHELAEVFPFAVHGEKDAVNEDGSIRPQGIDTSFLVATLAAAIQELKAEFDQYKLTHP